MDTLNSGALGSHWAPLPSAYGFVWVRKASGGSAVDEGRKYMEERQLWTLLPKLLSSIKVILLAFQGGVGVLFFPFKRNNIRELTQAYSAWKK